MKETAIPLLIVVVLALFLGYLLFHSERVQVVAEEHCQKILGTKHYQEAWAIGWKFDVQTYYVLEDGKEVPENYVLRHAAIWGDPYCETQFVPGSGMQKPEKVPHWEVPGLRSDK